MFVSATGAAIAAAPKVEFFLVEYDGYSCLSRAETALINSGFKMKGGTYKGEDRVGINGEFKGAVGCSTEVPNAVVFVVSGPNYETARTLARTIQRNFMISGR
jgi:hypothetical protein